MAKAEKKTIGHRFPDRHTIPGAMLPTDCAHVIVQIVIGSVISVILNAVAPAVKAYWAPIGFVAGGFLMPAPPSGLCRS